MRVRVVLLLGHLKAGGGPHFGVHHPLCCSVNVVI